MRPPRGLAAADDPRKFGGQLDAQLAATERAARAIAGDLTPAQFNWGPAPGRWSVGEHLAHLNIVDASYLPHLDAMIDGARVVAPADQTAARRSRPPRLGRWLGDQLVRSTEPPVRLRVRTAPQYAPPSTLDTQAVLADFAAGREALRERLARAAERLVDLDRTRARYTPGLGPAHLVVLSLRQWFALTAAHDRRHLWLAEQVISHGRFPADGRRERAHTAM